MTHMTNPDSTTTTQATSSPNGTTLTATESKVVKPGWRTTEFWLTFAAAFVGALLTSGLLADGSQVMRIAGMAAIALATLGYSVARGAAKGGSALVLIFALAVAPSSSGCAAFKSSARGAASSFVDCLAPNTKSLAGEIQGTVADVIRNATDNTGKVDWSSVRSSVRSYKSDAPLCAFQAAVTGMLLAARAPKDPDAPQSSGLDLDPASLSTGYESVRLELFADRLPPLESTPQ